MPPQRVKFTKHGVVSVRGRVDGARLVVEVEDACGGLPSGVEARIFDPFVQASEDRSGFGLGLAIARQAVEAHAGEVFVEDLPGRGCIVGLRLPLAAADARDA